MTTDYMTLMGAEDVLRAGHIISSAADSMSITAGYLNDNLQSFLQSCETLLQEHEARMREILYPTPSEKSLRGTGRTTGLLKQILRLKGNILYVCPNRAIIPYCIGLLGYICNNDHRAFIIITDNQVKIDPELLVMFTSIGDSQLICHGREPGTTFYDHACS